MVAKAEPIPEVKLTGWENDLCAFIRARQPGIFIQTLEESRALESLQIVAADLCKRGFGKRDFEIWSEVTHQKIDIGNPDARECAVNVPVFKALTEFMARTMEVMDRATGETVTVPKPGILVLTDMGGTLKRDSKTVRALREALAVIAATGAPKTIVFMGAPCKIPVELEPMIAILEYRLPTVAELFDLFKFAANQYKNSAKHKDIAPNESWLKKLARACAGITESEARGLMSLCVIKFRKIEQPAIDLALKQKAEIVKRGNVLEVLTPRYSLDEVGGLEHLKAWIDTITPQILNPERARAFGCEIPSGALFAGTPGSGKSLTVEAMAKHWNLPLLRFDVGAAFGGILGESEGNIRQMIQTANAVKPCVVFIDEIEKGLGGGDSMDGGTSNRVKQTLLTWLNDKPDEIFVAATANDLTKLEGMPELIRAGRLDATFFVDLPDMKSRIAILAIHAKLAGHPMDSRKLEPVAKLTRGFSGAELKRIIQTGVRQAFGDDAKHPSVKMYMDAAKEQKPLSVTMKEAIDRLRAWCADGRATPAGKTIDDDAADTAAFESDGLPML